MRRGWYVLALAAIACQPLKSDGPPFSETNMPHGLTGAVCAAASGHHYPPCCGADDRDRPFEDSIDCRESPVGDHISKSADAARAAGLTYDGYCVYDIIKVNWSECLDFGSGSFLGCDRDCQIYYGEVGEGAACEAYGHRMSDCQQGLVCAPDRSCHQACDHAFVAPEDGYCGPTRGMWFVACDLGLACDDEGICRPAAAVGEACDAATACAIGGWCEPLSGACVAGLAAGSPCTAHEQCGSEVCKEGVCFAPESPVCGRWAW